jgi:hypothetical protein
MGLIYTYPSPHSTAKSHHLQAKAPSDQPRPPSFAHFELRPWPTSREHARLQPPRPPAAGKRGGGAGSPGAGRGHRPPNPAAHGPRPRCQIPTSCAIREANDGHFTQPSGPWLGLGGSWAGLSVVRGAQNLPPGPLPAGFGGFINKPGAPGLASSFPSPRRKRHPLRRFV